MSEASPLLRASTSAALDYAWDAGPFLAEDVSRAKGLTKSTAIRAIDALIDAGLVIELPNTLEDGSYRFGRPARRFELNVDAGILVGMDAGRTHITTLASDLKGKILSSSHRVIDQDDAEGRRSATSDTIARTIESAGKAPKDVVALAIGIPAPVSHGVSPSHYEGFWENMNPGFQDFFAAQFPIVRIENDAGLAALAELSQGPARTRNNFVAMLAGDRMGAGVVLGGKLAYGAHGGVGELGILKHLRGAGGSKGLVHLTDKWMKEYLADGTIPASHPLARADQLTPDLEFSYVTANDPALKPLIDRASLHLASVGELLAYMYDPEIIVISGGIATQIGPILSRANAELQARSHVPPPTIIASTLGHDVVSIGAIAAAREAARAGILELLA
ncbi:ROK family transcriptional regulator [Ancrocorticia populi]|uniref:ROK family protein n=1 Tax=Ancrocorticia populi TaxID=2175228 RepID=A0A2V1K718_9ACTO|nr:ROK family transcriptional regulator [Ancrocorticia populi]PWF26092.1 ROK family protein [Ancrocorticia populi]